MIDKVKSFLLTRGYQIARETSSVVMYRETSEQIYLILLTEYNRRISNLHNVQAADNLKKSYAKITGKKVSFLNLCFTQDGLFDEELELTEKISGIWLIAKDTGRIYVFENQPQEFDRLFQALEQECQKVENRIRFIPYANLLLVILITGIFIYIYHFLGAAASERILLDFGLDWSRIIQFNEWYRLFTCMFLHADAAHIYGNMLLLFFIGNHMEECLGHAKYLLLYFSTGLAASIGSMVYHSSISDSTVCIGASGAIMGILGAMTGLLIVYHGKSKWFTLRRLLIFLGLTLAQGMLAPQIDNIAHVCGFLAGLLFALLCYHRDKKMYKS